MPGTNPTNALSVLRLLSLIFAAPGLIVSWQSVSGQNYLLERITNLAGITGQLAQNVRSRFAGQESLQSKRDENSIRHNSNALRSVHDEEVDFLESELGQTSVVERTSVVRC